MAERSTAAIDVADNSGNEPLPAKAEQDTTDAAASTGDGNGTGEAADDTERVAEPDIARGPASGTPERSTDGPVDEVTAGPDALGASRDTSMAPAEAPTAPLARAQGAEADPGPAGDSGSGTPPSVTNPQAAPAASPVQPAEPPVADSAGKPDASAELHSGHKLAERYRLEECVTRLDGFSSWRAVDEKLRRAVGVHLMAADHPRVRSVLAAARSSALLADPRFVQVLDAVEEDDVVYVVQEWLPDATELATLLESGPLEMHEAYQMVSQVAQAMTAAHREGLAHLRLVPSAVLRTSSGQWRVRGLGVNAALRGITSDAPQRADVEAIGALLYVSLTQRWPYENDAYGLSGLPKGVGLIAPDQVRAGVHRGLSELAMRALVNDGATASRQEPPCTTAEDLLKAIGKLPRIRPPEPAFPAPSAYQHTTYQQGVYRRPPAGGPVAAPPVVPPPPPLQSRTGRALKWCVSALLIVALGLGSWQLADALMENGRSDGGQGKSKTHGGGSNTKSALTGQPLTITDANEFTPMGSGIKEEQVSLTVDGERDTAWVTPQYKNYPHFGNLPNRKDGSGIIVDLGSVKKVSGLDIDLYRSGQKVEVLAADPGASSPGTLADFPQQLTKLTTVGTTIKQNLDKTVRTRYVLVHITSLPVDGVQGLYRGGISEIKVLGPPSE